MFPVFSYKAAAYFYARSHLTVPFPSSLSLMTERHIADMLLGADAPTPTSHPPPTATIYTDPPTTHHGHFLPTNPMPPATHQPELHWLLHTITTLVDDLQHHPLVHDPIPPMSSFTNTPAYRLYLQLSPLDQQPSEGSAFFSSCLVLRAHLVTTAWIPQ